MAAGGVAGPLPLLLLQIAVTNAMVRGSRSLSIDSSATQSTFGDPLAVAVVCIVLIATCFGLVACMRCCIIHGCCFCFKFFPKRRRPGTAAANVRRGDSTAVAWIAGKGGGCKGAVRARVVRLTVSAAPCCARCCCCIKTVCGSGIARQHCEQHKCRCMTEA